MLKLSADWRSGSMLGYSPPVTDISIFFRPSADHCVCARYAASVRKGHCSACRLQEMDRKVDTLTHLCSGLSQRLDTALGPMACTDDPEPPPSFRSEILRLRGYRQGGKGAVTTPVTTLGFLSSSDLCTYWGEGRVQHRITGARAFLYRRVPSVRIPGLAPRLPTPLSSVWYFWVR